MIKISLPQKAEKNIWRENHMKKVLLIALCVVMAFSCIALTSCSTNEPAQSAAATSEAPAESSAAAASDAHAGGGAKTIGVSMMTFEHPFFSDMLAQIKYMAKEAGYTVVSADAGQDPTKQLDDINDMIVSGVDVLFINPVDSAAIGSAVKDANDKDIPVFCIDTTADEGELVSFVASDNKEMGRVDANKVVEALKEKNGEEKGTVLAVVYPQASSTRDREAGFDEVMAQYPGINIEKTSPISISSDDAYTLMQDKLSAYATGDLDVIYSITAPVTVGIIGAIDTAGRTDILLVGTDEDDAIFDKMKEEDTYVLGTVVQYPTEIAKYAFEAYQSYLEGNTVDAETFVPVKAITNSAEVDEFQQFKTDYRKELESFYN